VVGKMSMNDTGTTDAAYRAFCWGDLQACPRAADRLRDALVTWAHDEMVAGFLFVMCVPAVATATATPDKT